MKYACIQTCICLNYEYDIFSTDEMQTASYSLKLGDVRLSLKINTPWGLVRASKVKPCPTEYIKTKTNVLSLSSLPVVPRSL